MTESSLRRRLLTWLMPPLLGLWLAGALLAYYFVLDFSRGVHDKWLLDSAVTLAQQVHVSAGQASVDLPPDVLRVLVYDALDQIHYRVTDARDKVIAGRPDMPGPAPRGTQPLFYDGEVDGVPVRVVALRLSEREGEVAIQVAETLNKRRLLIREILAAMLLPQLLLIACAGLLIWIGVGRGLSPLRKVRSDILARSHRDLSPLAAESVPAEIAPIVRALNDLFARLDNAVAGQNRFIADAAHQLRTPLAGLKTQAELAMREDNPAKMRAALDRVGVAIDRSIRLVNQLLALARADHSRESPVASETLDLGRLARTATEDWVGKAVDTGHDLGFEPPAGAVQVHGNAELLREMLDNLIDNALRYTPAGGHVTVRVVAHENSPVIEVEDDGPGIAPAEREHVFERFYRVMGSRAEGSGLGLSIVREIAGLHGARVEVHAAAGATGTRVSVIFPARSAAD